MPDNNYIAKVNYYLHDTGVMKTFEESYKRDKHAIGAGVCHPRPGQPGFLMGRSAVQRLVKFINQLFPISL
jgi:hypothetical protein